MLRDLMDMCWSQLLSQETSHLPSMRSQRADTLFWKELHLDSPKDEKGTENLKDYTHQESQASHPKIRTWDLNFHSEPLAPYSGHDDRRAFGSLLLQWGMLTQKTVMMLGWVLHVVQHESFGLLYGHAQATCSLGLSLEHFCRVQICCSCEPSYKRLNFHMFVSEVILDLARPYGIGKIHQSLCCYKLC